MTYYLTKEEEIKIKKIEKEFKVRLVNLTFHKNFEGKNVPCYHFKAKKGNTVRNLFKTIYKGGEKEKDARKNKRGN